MCIRQVLILQLKTQFYRALVSEKPLTLLSVEVLYISCYREFTLVINRIRPVGNMGPMSDW
jgi:hypothetical protein